MGNKIFSVASLAVFVLIGMYQFAPSVSANHQLLDESQSVPLFNINELPQVNGSPDSWLQLEWIDRFHIRATVQPVTIVTDDHGTIFDTAQFLDGSIFSFKVASDISSFTFTESANSNSGWEPRITIDRFNGLEGLLGGQHTDVIDIDLLLTHLATTEITIGFDEDMFGGNTSLDCDNNNDKGFFYTANSSDPATATSWDWSCGSGTNSGKTGFLAGQAFTNASLTNFNITYIFDGDANFGNVVPLTAFGLTTSGTASFNWCPGTIGEFRTECGTTNFRRLSLGSQGGLNPAQLTTLNAIGTGAQAFFVTDQDNNILSEVVVAGSESPSSEVVDPDLVNTLPGAGVGEGVLASTSCESSIPGVGWFLCGVAKFMVKALDGVISDFIVQNILSFEALDASDGSNGGQRDALNSIWVGFRTLANVGFVIAFFVLIYAAATGGALSSYDVKKLLPKLLIGAILVQLSFFICIQLVEIFNDLGNGIVDIMLAPLPGSSGSSGGIGTLFNNDSGFATVDTLGEVLTGIVSSLILVLVIVGVVFSLSGVMLIIVVFIVRNMALMVLTVISPLAFVAWIMPNTENLFKKWWGAYIQLLALFPIAMAFLSSGKLVSYIWTNGSTNWANQWIGMIALFAPYVLAPKMFSFAGSAVNGVIRGVQDGKKSIQESTGKAAQTRLGKKARANKLIGENNRLLGKDGKFTRTGNFINRAARVGTNPGASGLNRFGGDRVRRQGAASNVHDNMRKEDDEAQATLYQEEIGHLGNKERKKNSRDVANDRSKSTSSRTVAMEQMIIDNDFDGIEHAMQVLASEGEGGRRTVSRFKNKNAATLGSKARHILTSDVGELALAGTTDTGDHEEDRARDGNVTGALAFLGSDGDTLDPQHGSSSLSSVMDVGHALKRSRARQTKPRGNTSEEQAYAAKLEQSLLKFAETIDGLDDQDKAKLKDGTKDAALLAEQLIGASTVQIDQAKHKKQLDDRSDLGLGHDIY